MAAVPQPFDISDTFGALLIGALVTMMIYGITTLQAYLYYISFPKDGTATKLLVALIWCLDTLHAVFMCQTVHYYLIVGFVDHNVLADGTWTLFMSVTVNILLSFIAQGFFTHRIFLLCSLQRRWWVTGVIGICVVAHFGFGIVTVVNLFKKKKFVLLKEISYSSAVPFGAAAILSDILIAVTLCVLLDSKRSTFKDTNSIINKLIIFAINRCILTSAVAIVETIVFCVLPNSFYSFAIDFVIGKLYANSLLAVLNSRATFRAESQQDCTSTELSTRFNIASAVANHRTSLIQVRTRDSSRDGMGIESEKAGTKRGSLEENRDNVYSC